MFVVRILTRGVAGVDQPAVDSLLTLLLPDMPATVRPLVDTIPVQLLEYHTAAVTGTDVDQSPTLAKSGTVE